MPPVRRAAARAASKLDIWTLFETSDAAHADLANYLAKLLNRCAEWFDATGASIFLADPHRSCYVLAAKAGYESSVPDGATIRSGIGIAGRCIETRAAILVADPKDHPALAGSVRKRNRKLGSSVVVPLLAGEECIGVLNLSRSIDEPKFELRDLRYAESLAGHIALAVANAELLNRLQRAATEAVRMHAKLDAILSALAVAVVVLDRAQNVVHLNAEAGALGGTEGWLQPTLTGFAAQCPDWLRVPLQEVAEASLAGRRASAVAREPEGERVLSLTGSPLTDGGATIAIHDATEHEAVLHEMSRVRRLAEIGQMTAAIAHEIRNPLWAMRAAAQVLQTDPEHAPEFGKIIEDEVVKLNELCTGFLDFARPLELHLQRADLSETVGRAVALHRPQFEAAGVPLSVHCPPGAICDFDPIRIEQVVRNLLLNALDACADGGEVQIRVEPGLIVVRDTGRGMEQIQIEKLFTPFFTTKADGTGLGLSTVRKIVDAHRGRIRVDSEPGKGTSFTVAIEGQAA